MQLKELIRLLGNTPVEPVKEVSSDVSAVILSLLKQHSGWRVPNLVKASGKSQATMERYLRQLREQDQIEFRGAPKNGGYFVK